MKEYSHIPESLRKKVFKLLDKDPLLKPKKICKLLDLNYAERGLVVAQYKKQWKKEYANQRGSNRSIPDDIHNAFYKGKIKDPKVVFGLLPSLVKSTSWRMSRAKNKYWIFRNGLGRIRFFMNGTVELWVKKPASTGKAMQLFSNAFTWTHLIDSIKTVEEFQKTLMIKMHTVFDYGQRVPYMKITAFENTHKFVFVSGDKSHPTCAEFMFEYNAEVESSRRLFEQMSSFFEQFSPKQNGDVRSKLPSQDYSV